MNENFLISLELSFTVEELQGTCEKMNHNKAPSLDGIPNIALKLKLKSKWTSSPSFSKCIRMKRYALPSRKAEIGTAAKISKETIEPRLCFICLLVTIGKIMGRVEIVTRRAAQGHYSPLLCNIMYNQTFALSVQEKTAILGLTDDLMVVAVVK